MVTELKTPISLITGPLGSGKTTLLQRILEAGGWRLAVLMNEFGEIAIDSQVIRGDNVNIVELAGGCVCCELAGEFEAAVVEIIDKFHPELIVLEATGVAESDALVYAVEDNLPQVRLDSVISIVDVYVSTKFPQLGYVQRTQLEAADLVLLNKIDLATPEQVKQVESQVRQFNERALLFHTVRCELDVKLLFGLDVQRQVVPVEHKDEPAFESFVFNSDKPLDEEKFREAIQDLPPDVYRAKGFVRFADGGYLFNYVVDRHDLEEFPADKTQLVFIGMNLKDAKDALLKRLQACVT